MIQDAAKYGQRGRAALTNQYRHDVEGEMLTTRQIAERTGRSIRSINTIIAKKEPLTWHSFTTSSIRTPK